MQIGKSTPLPPPHRLLHNPVLHLCLTCRFLPLFSSNLHSVPSHAGMVPNSVHLCSPPITRCIMTPYPWLALSCFALLQPLSLSLTASLFPSPLLFLSVAAFLRSVPLSVVKEWQTHGRDKKREAGISNSSLRRYSWTISSGSLLDLTSVGSYVEHYGGLW